MSRRQIRSAGGALLSRRGAVVVSVAAVALGLSLFFMVFGDDQAPGRSAGADSFSRSALGYHALVAFLEELGATVVVTRYRPLESVGPRAGLVLLEPPTDPELVAGVRELVEGALARGAPVLVVLPERAWKVDPTDPSRVTAVDPLRPGRVRRLVAASTGMDGGEGDTGGGAAPTPERRDLPLAEQHWRGSLAEGARVELVEPQVLPLDGTELTPELFGHAGAVVLRDRGRPLTLVTDPDLLNTHGIGRGDNALVARRLFLEAAGSTPAPEVWVVDETLHGFERAPSVTRELLAFPLSLFTVQVALLAVVAVWSAARRFGRAQPLPPRVPKGVSTLLENTARLLDLGGHHGATLDGYLDAVLDRADEVLAVGPTDTRRERVARLAAAARLRGVGEDLDDIARRVVVLRGHNGEGAAAQGERVEAFILARRLHRWCEEVLDGAR